MKPASSSPSVGLNQHPLWTSAFRTILKTRHEIACQKSQGRPSQKKEGAESKPVHITGQATVVLTEDNRNRKSSRAPCPVGLNQHVLGPAPDYDVRNGRNDETGRSRETRAEGERKESQRSPACGWIRQAKNLFQRSTEPPAAIGIAACDRERQLEPRRTVITAFASSREIGDIACLRRTTSLRHPQVGTRPFPFLHRSSSSFFVEPGIDL
jgi:hypothetical protein